MKNLLLILLSLATASMISAQESLIADIMAVDPVNITIGEEDQKKVDEYDKRLSESTTKLDEELQKLGETYAKDVTKLIEGFTGTMDKGDEKVIKNEKKRVSTSTNTYTFNLIKNKKQAIQRFENNASIEIRKLPKPIAKMKTKELSDKVEEYRDNIHKEFEANQMVLKAFKATEHVKKTHVSEMPEGETDNG